MNPWSKQGRGDHGEGEGETGEEEEGGYVFGWGEETKSGVWYGEWVRGRGSRG